MPRTYGKSKGRAKQTRLSFVPAEFTTDAQDDERHSRDANVRYSHPSLSTLRSGRSKEEKASKPAPFVRNEPEDVFQSESEKPSKEKKRERKKAKKSQKSTKNEATPAPPAPPTAPPATQEIDSDSDLEIIHSARKTPRGNMKRKRVESSEPEEQQASDESDADEVVSRPRRKLRRGGAPQPVVIDEESDEQVRPTVSKSPSVPHTPRRDSAQDRIDIKEDLEDLQDSVVRASRTRGNVANSARAQRQRHLEALRRRRAGEKEESEDQLSPQPEDSGSENEDEDKAEDEEAAVRQPQFRNWANESESSDVESTIGANDDLDQYEDDFVLDDEDDKLGVPSGLEDMPIEFSRHAYKQLKDYFQDAVEWMVQNQLNPAFPRSDPVYRVAFDKLEAEVRGRTGSQLISSVWNSDFSKALLARPHIEITTYPLDLCHPCDACNRSGHPASFDMKLSGKAYSLETLEPLADADSDEESGDDEDGEEERDRDGFVLPDEDRRFHLGRHCKKNAALAHTLSHWRFHLNEWVVEHLRILGYMSDKKILKRNNYSQKKKNKHTAKAFNKMLESGEIKKLWRDFHINLKTAREATD